MPPGPRRGAGLSLMKRQSIVFSQLLDNVLPVDRLPLLDQAEIHAALQESDPRRMERLALEAIEKLTRLGHLRLLEEEIRGDDRFLRYRDMTSSNTISLRLTGPDPNDGLVRIPMPLRDWRGATSLDQIRTILGLYGRILGKDSNILASVPEILRQLIETARSLLGCDQVTFSPTRRTPRADYDLAPELIAPPYDPFLLQEWVVERNYLIHVPDLPAVVRDGSSVPENMHSLALVKLGDPASGVAGAIQAWSTRAHFFNEDRLALLALLSESGTDLLGRAALLGNLVFVDAATKVYNRAYFNIQLDNEIARARREGKSLALAIFDIDDFKFFNTQYGYEGGNEVLARVARLLKSGLRPFDSVARWGGEEFALILTAPISEADARMVTARLRRAVERQSFAITGLEGKSHNVTLTISGGGALYPDDAITAADLWRSANSALMWSKEHGKNRVSFCSDLSGGPRTQEDEPR